MSGQNRMDEYYEHAKKELGPKMASSAYVITLNPDDVDPKVAMETGYAVLMDKPIVLVSWKGRGVNPGLARIATHHVALNSNPSTDAGAQELMARLATINRELGLS